jgi:hypothetical protein
LASSKLEQLEDFMEEGITQDVARRELLKVTAAGVGLAPVLVRDSLAQTLDPEAAERVLSPARVCPAAARWKFA